MRRWILGVLSAVIVAVVLLIGYAVVDQTVITPQRPVALVETVEIPHVEFQKAVRYKRVQLLNEYQNYYQIIQYLGTQQQYQDRLDVIKDQLDNPVEIGRTTLQNLIQQELVRQEASRMGIAISQVEVEQQIQSFFGYNSKSEHPTPTPYTPLKPQATPNEGHSPTPSPTSTPFTEETFQELYSIYIDDLKADTGMTKENVEQLFEIQLLTGKVRQSLTDSVTSEEEHVNARHILFSLDDEDLAQDVLARVLAGDDFGNLANEFSTDSISASNGGSLGWFPRGQMVTPFETVVFGAETGIIPFLAETQFGYHIVEVLGRETRPMSEDIILRRNAQVYNQWMADQVTSSNISTLDWWEPNVPTEPTLEQYFHRLQQRQEERKTEPNE